MYSPEICFLGLDLEKMVELIDSVALAQATLNHTKTEWKSDEAFTQSRVFRSLYAVLGYCRPGTAEVTQDVCKIEADRERLKAQYWKTATHKIVQGPAPILTYLQALEEIRDYAVKAVRDVFRDAHQINSDIADATHEAVAKLADIRLASTLLVLPTAVVVGIFAVATGTAAGLALQLGVASAAYQVIGGFARSVQEGHCAKAVAVKTGKPLGEYAIDRGYDAGSEKFLEHTTEGWKDKAARDIQSAQREIDRLARDLRRKIGAKKVAKLSRQIDRQEKIKIGPLHGIRNAKVLAGATKFIGISIQLAFLAWDLHESLEEFDRDANNKAIETNETCE